MDKLFDQVAKLRSELGVAAVATSAGSAATMGSVVGVAAATGAELAAPGAQAERRPIHVAKPAQEADAAPAALTDAQRKLIETKREAALQRGGGRSLHLPSSLPRGWKRMAHTSGSPKVLSDS